MRIYRGILWLLAPLVLLWLLWRRLSGKDSARAFAERRGCGLPAPEAPRLWLHGASNGELASARWLLTSLISHHETLEAIVTCNTETGREMVAGWGLPRVRVALAPVDLGRPLRRFLNRWRPRALLVLENELWPNRIATCARRGVPVLIFGARMSEKSARVWHRVPGLAAELFAAVSYLSAQDAASAGRFTALGLGPDRLGPVFNLKSRPAPAPRAGERLIPDDLRAAFHPGTTLLAASTHEGEDAAVLDAFAIALSENQAERLILAPRHPRRRAEIAALIAARGLSLATRSAGEAPGARPGGGPGAAQVYLADTMGEMDLWYRLAGITFVGGSLVPAGGHTPYEPARYGSAILHGPEVANFAREYAELDRAGGALMVADAGALARAFAELSDPVRRARMAAAAQEVLADAPAGAEAALCSALAGALHLPELRF